MSPLPSLLRRWEALLLAILLVVVLFNVTRSPFYLRIDNLINLFELSIEKIIVVLVMTFIIINGEIDLSVASVMGLAACVVARLHADGVAMPLAVLVALLVGLACGAFNGFWIAYVGLPSLAVTLAGLIGYRGAARILLEDKSIGNFPEWFNVLGQQPLIGPFPFAILLFFGMLIAAVIILQRTTFGRYVYVIGNNKEVARYSGIQVRQVKMRLFMASGLIAALAGVLLAARLGAVRGNTAEGFELDIITMVLLGGVSIFGGSGTLTGVALSILIILNLRNGMSLANITGNTQTGVIGALLILSVLVPNLVSQARGLRSRVRPASSPLAQPSQEVEMS
ncbi:MAG: monosaccharide-transporting ATPase [Candidatus Roseilinea sp.]|nr:MAG: monosaccharide-transporting ATPase [Candidatus Roseilinea sp.]